MERGSKRACSHWMVSDLRFLRTPATLEMLLHCLAKGLRKSISILFLHEWKRKDRGRCLGFRPLTRYTKIYQHDTFFYFPVVFLLKVYGRLWSDITQQLRQN